MTYLKTDRLVLKEIGDQDFDFIVDLVTRPETNEYDSDEVPSRISIIGECVWYMEAVKRLPEQGAIRFIVSDQSGEKIGNITLKCNWVKTREWEIGYAFLKKYWGKGYASEALKKVIEYAFDDLKIHKMMAFINAENTKSVALAKRIGMVQEGYMRDARLVKGVRYDEYVFSLLKRDLHNK